MLTRLTAFGTALLLCACQAVPTPSGPTETLGPANIPPPPAAQAIAGETPEQRAIAAAHATEPGQAGTVAGWLGTYELLRIPVLGDTGPIGSTGDDPIGPPFWRVWYASAMTARPASFRLVDVVRIFGLPNEALDGGEAARTLLDDVRSAIGSDDPVRRTLGLFVAEKFRRASAGVDPLDPDLAVDAVRVDGATAELLSWLVIRGYTVLLASNETASTDAGSPADPDGGIARPAAVGFALTQQRRVQPASVFAGLAPCSQIYGNADVEYWLTWVISTLGGGLTLPGMTALPGLIDLVNKLDPDLFTETMATKAKGIAGKAGLMAALLTLLMQYYTLRIDAIQEPDPLERTRYATYNGMDGEVVWRLSIDPKLLPDGENAVPCAISFLLTAFGISFNFPRGGRIPGAEIAVAPGVGFGSIVLFGPTPKLTVVTDQNGEAATPVQGTAQERDLPESAPRVDKEFSIHVEAQPQAVDGNTMWSVFFSGLTFGTGPSAPGGIGGAIEIAKTFHWDLGEWFFRLRDWGAGAPSAFVGEVVLDHHGNPDVGGTDLRVDITAIRFERVMVPFAGRLAYEAVSGTVVYHETWKTTECSFTVDATGSIPDDVAEKTTTDYTILVDISDPGAPRYSGFSIVRMTGTQVIDCTTDHREEPYEVGVGWFSPLADDDGRSPLVTLSGGTWILEGSDDAGLRWRFTGTE